MCGYIAVTPSVCYRLLPFSFSNCSYILETSKLNCWSLIWSVMLFYKKKFQKLSGSPGGPKNCKKSTFFIKKIFFSNIFIMNKLSFQICFQGFRSLGFSVIRFHIGGQQKKYAFQNSSYYCWSSHVIFRENTGAVL